jgi:hypothetical protein
MCPELLQVAGDGDAGKVSDFIIRLMMNRPEEPDSWEAAPTYRDFLPSPILAGVLGPTYSQAEGGGGEAREGIEKPLDHFKALPIWMEKAVTIPPLQSFPSGEIVSP